MKWEVMMKIINKIREAKKKLFGEWECSTLDLKHTKSERIRIHTVLNTLEREIKEELIKESRK